MVHRPGDASLVAQGPVFAEPAGRPHQGRSEDEEKEEIDSHSISWKNGKGSAMITNEEEFVFGKLHEAPSHDKGDDKSKGQDIERKTHEDKDLAARALNSANILKQMLGGCLPSTRPGPDAARGDCDICFDTSVDMGSQSAGSLASLCDNHYVDVL